MFARKRIIVLVAGATLCLSSAAAFACSYALGPYRTANYPKPTVQEFPTNGVFLSSNDWRSESSPLVLIEDPEMSALFQQPARRSTQGDLTPGQVLYGQDHCPATGTCQYEMQVGNGPDLTPPERAVVESLRTQFVENPSGAGCLSCPDLDTIELKVVGDDDTTPREYLSIAAWIGASEEEVLSKIEIDTVFTYDPVSPGEDFVTTIIIGESVGHVRDGEAFRAPGRFCFSVALIDWAGNLGERSEAHCLDTTDPDDPNTESAASEGCSAVAAQGSWLWLSLITLLFWRQRRRREDTLATPQR